MNNAMNSIDSSHMEIFWACGVFDNAMIMPVRLGDTKNKLVVVRGTNTRGQINGYAWNTRGQISGYAWNKSCKVLMHSNPRQSIVNSWNISENMFGSFV